MPQLNARLATQKAECATQAENCARAAIRNYLTDNTTDATAYIDSIERICSKKGSTRCSRAVLLERHSGISVLEAALLAHDKGAFKKGPVVEHLRQIPPNFPSMGAHDALLALGHYAVELNFVAGSAAIAAAAATRAGATTVIYHIGSPFFSSALRHSPSMAAATFGAMGASIGGKVYAETVARCMGAHPENHKAALRAIWGIETPAVDSPTNLMDFDAPLDSPGAGDAGTPDDRQTHREPVSAKP